MLIKDEHKLDKDNVLYAVAPLQETPRFAQSQIAFVQHVL